LCETFSRYRYTHGGVELWSCVIHINYYYAVTLFFYFFVNSLRSTWKKMSGVNSVLNFMLAVQKAWTKE
jgi:hypothetical protein